MSGDNWDPFKPGTGLKDDYDGTVKEAEFVQTQQGSWALNLTIEAEDGDSPELRLGVGGKASGWTSFDGGETIENEGKARATFNERTGYARFIGAAMKSGAEDVLRSRSTELYGGRGPMNAGLWVGLAFHFEVVHVPSQRPDEEGTWKDVEGGIPTVLPVKYLGDSVPQPGKSAGTGDVKTGRASTKGNPGSSQSTQSSLTNSESGLPAIHHQDLIILHQLANDLDYGSFVDQVMTLKDQGGVSMTRNKAVMAKLGDESWYEELKG
jgi:hypothetical protein